MTSDIIQLLGNTCVIWAYLTGSLFTWQSYSSESDPPSCMMYVVATEGGLILASFPGACIALNFFLFVRQIAGKWSRLFLHVLSPLLYLYPVKQRGT